jgi:hypothetical protein
MSSSRKCEKCGAVTWSDSLPCSRCQDGLTKVRIPRRFRIYILLILGAAAAFGTYRYLHRVVPPNDEEVRAALVSVAAANAPARSGNFYQVMSVSTEWRLESYGLRGGELYETNEGTRYSAHFWVSSRYTDQASSRLVVGQIRFKLVDQKWVSDFVAVKD